MILFLIPFTTGICAILVTYYYSFKLKSRSLFQLFKVVTSLNFIIFFGLLLQLLASQSLNISSLVIGFILSTSLFICRFYFLFSFYKLIEISLHETFLKAFTKPFKVTIYIIVICYVIAWIEPLFWRTKSIEETLMIYTDIIVLVAVLGGGIFLFKSGKQSKFKRYRREIEFLGITFLIPMSLAILKWVLSKTEFMADTIIERSAIYIFGGLFNLLTILWLLLVKGNIKFIEAINKEINSGDFVHKYGISKRELEIIKLISEGKTNQNIADELFISIETVKDHNTNIFLKTNVKNRTQLTKLFLDAL